MTPEPYKCFNCHKEPVCAECGYGPSHCPHCDVDYKVTLSDWDGKDESKLVWEPGIAAIDLDLWDGSDMFGHMVTHRMLQYLLGRHARPFRAEPIPVDVKGATPYRLELLEAVRVPI